MLQHTESWKTGSGMHDLWTKIIFREFPGPGNFMKKIPGLSRRCGNLYKHCLDASGLVSVPGSKDFLCRLFSRCKDIWCWRSSNVLQYLPAAVVGIWALAAWEQTAGHAVEIYHRSLHSDIPVLQTNNTIAIIIWYNIIQQQSQHGKLTL